MKKVLCFLIVFALLPTSAFAAPGYLTINRLPNLGGGVGAFISIDSVSVARIGWGESYRGSLAPGDHLISVTVAPNFLFEGPAERRLTVESGQTYMLTLRWKGARLVLKQVSE